jgi:hypothetical protein
MDFFDSVHCLEFVLHHEHKKKMNPMLWSELKNKLEICRMTLKEAGTRVLHEEERALLTQQIQLVEEGLNIHTAELYSAAAATGILPKSFYLHHTIGGVPYERVVGTTSFQVRGERYISDSRKVKTPKLFPCATNYT